MVINLNFNKLIDGMIDGFSESLKNELAIMDFNMAELH